MAHARVVATGSPAEALRADLLESVFDIPNARHPAPEPRAPARHARTAAERQLTSADAAEVKCDIV